MEQFNADGRQWKKLQAGFDILRKNNWITYLISILIIGGVLLFGIPADRVPMTQQLGNENFAIQGVQGDPIFVFYRDVRSVEERSQLDKGTVLNGTDTGRVWSGAYSNSEFGEYSLHAYVKVKKYIVVRYKDGVLVFNGNSEKDTDTLYSSLLEMTKKK